MRNGLLPVILFVVGCRLASGVVFDESLVQPFSALLQEKEPIQAPFLSRFARDGDELHYLASNHENRIGTRTFRLVDLAFSNDAPRSVILEGFPNNLGPSPASMVRYWKATSDGTFYEGGEGAYAGLIAAARQIRFVGGEPPERDVAKTVWENGYTPEDLLGFYVVRQIPQWKRNGSLKKATIESLYETLMREYRERLELTETPSFAQFRQWYHQKNGRGFDPALIDAEESGPIADGTYYTQRISCLVEMIRNRFIVRTIGHELSVYRQVLIIYGRGHLPCQRPALEHALGPGQVE